MEQKRIIPLLTRKLAGEATPEELQELEGLLALFPEALYYEETLKQITFKDEPPEEIDIEKAFKEHEQKYGYEFDDYIKQEAISPQSYVKYWLVAASFLIACCFAFYFHYHKRSILYSPTTEVVCGKRMRKQIVLPDGTTVWLNTNSKLQYDNAMLQKDHREVRLYGEAFFDVAKDKKHPFIIRTQKITIKVLGTAFNVKAYLGDHVTETTLIRGIIQLSLNSDPQQRILLRPKEKFILNDSVSQRRVAFDKNQSPKIHSRLVIEDVEPVEISNKDYLEETSWMQNKLVFKNESFKELIPKLEKWYNVTFKVNNQAVEDYQFTGIFENETITQALKEMQLIRPFKFNMTADDVVTIN